MKAKYISILIFILAFCIQGKAQNTLTLDSVITITDFITDNACSNSTLGPVYTVPSGKVWKVESIYFQNLGNGNSLRINGVRYVLSTNFQNNFKLPFWLKAGDTLQFEYNNNCSGCPGCSTAIGTWEYFCSIIQFNL